MIGAIFSAIGIAFGWLADKATTIAIAVWQALVAVGIAIAHFAVSLTVVFARVFEFLGRFWTNVLKPFITWSWQQIERLSGWLKRTFDPVLRFLHDVRAELMKIYDRWLRPIFDTIEVMRRVLQILSALHIALAKELDAKLAQLEDLLMKPIREIYFRLNEVMDWINRIVTLDGLLQRVTLIESLWHYTGDAWNVLLKHQPAGVSADANAQLRQQTVEPINAQALVDQVTQYYMTRSGDLAPAVEESAALALTPLQTR